MEIKIVNDINDPYLKTRWNYLAEENDYFPQSSYHWCATWWKYLNGKRKLHILVVSDNAGDVVGIAPLCIERTMGIRLLRSFPINFADFYTFLFAKNNHTKAVLDTLFDYIQTFAEWDLVRLDQVNGEDIIFDKYLRESTFIKKHFTDCIVADFEGRNWDDFLLALKKNHRADIKRRMKRLEKEKRIKLKCVSGWEEIKGYLPALKQIYNDRWVDDYLPEKADNQLVCEDEIIKNISRQDKMKLYVLVLGDEAVAYTLGFMHQGFYWYWQTSYSLKHQQYSIGIMILAYIVKDLISSGCRGINFMAGIYDWKMKWSPKQQVSPNYMCILSSGSIRSRLLANYYVKWRGKLKKSYHRLLINSHFKTLSRIVIAGKQHLERTR